MMSLKSRAMKLCQLGADKKELIWNQKPIWLS